MISASRARPVCCVGFFFAASAHGKVRKNGGAMTKDRKPQKQLTIRERIVGSIVMIIIIFGVIYVKETFFEPHQKFPFMWADKRF